MRPKVFIGSSAKNIDIANEVQVLLEYDCDCTVWNQDLFLPSSQTLLKLIDIVHSFDFGIFIFLDDDISKINGKEYATVRDNVIFEIGLFVGHLGIDRSFIVAPRDVPNLHLPTDLLGITPAQFFLNRDDKNLNAALGPACTKIRKLIKERGRMDKNIKSSIINDTIIHQAAGVCYKMIGGRIHLMLIRTGGGRWSFPKGMLSKFKEHSETARSEAYNEAGVKSDKKVEYIGVYSDIKKGNGKQTELTIAAFLMKSENEIEPFEQNRNPTWFDVSDVLEKLSAGRQYNQINSLENIITKVKEKVE